LINKLAFLALLVTLAPASAAGQTNGQLWGDLTLEWKQSARRSIDVDFEPKVLVISADGAPKWVELGATPKFTYSAASWLDVGTELLAAYTVQTNQLKSFELTPRVDVRIHFFSREMKKLFHDRELPPKRRVVLRDLARFEFRNLFYNQNRPTKSTERFRNRVELLVSLNKENLAMDGAFYLTADWEWFVPISDVTERFANQQRTRAGLAHRRSYRWETTLAYVWQRSRSTASTGFKTSDNAIDFRVKRIF